MANTKNTIQNIPLTGPLCLNKLKTDVTQFEGYNEKNTTVFGGELVPIHEKKTELGDKDTTYTIFNSKGEPFTISKTNDGVKLNNEFTLFIPIVHEYSTPDKTLWSEVFGTDQPFQICLTSDGKVYVRYGETRSKIEDELFIEIHDFNTTINDVQSFSTWKMTVNNNLENMLCVAFISNNKLYHLVALYEINQTVPTVTTKRAGVESLSTSIFTETSFVSIGRSIDTFYICAVPFSGKKEINSDDYVIMRTIKYNNGTLQSSLTHKKYFYTNESIIGDTEITNEKGFYTFYIAIDQNMQVDDFTPKTVEVIPDSGSIIVYQGITYPNKTLFSWFSSKYLTGHDGNYYLPGIKTMSSYPADVVSSGWSNIQSYYLNGALYALSIMGRLISTPGSIKANECSVRSHESITCKNKDGIWQTFTYTDKADNYDFNYIINNFHKICINNRYIPILGRYDLYDVETKKIIRVDLSSIDTIIPGIPDNGEAIETTGLIYAAGFNVNYPISGIPFTSLLMNPKVMIGLPSNFVGSWSGGRYHHWTSSVTNLCDIFYSLGDEVQSAAYQGGNSEFANTVYPIDINGNIIYPITWNSEVINGYSNNDLIKEDDTTYPLIYWNNNQKMYSYYLLSSMEGITGAFALQGQQYTLDDSNIYNVQFSNGLVQSVTTVCYKKNMQFLGTLPTSAVFYSKYNKTFYQFTGDNILTKMFEANDINEIKMVGQNPSTLSLWICTDNGVYVLSDTDMFKLDFEAEDIYFNEEKTIIVTDELIEDTHKWVENDISLYDIGDEAEEKPVKLATKYYGLGSELKANLDCWYIRLHNADHKNGKLKLKVNTITNTSFETEEKTFDITQNMYDANDQIYIRYQPKYQTAVAMQLELESDIAIYQISLGVNATDAVAQQSKFNF